jgi:putative ABC transport system permease protein
MNLLSLVWAYLKAKPLHTALNLLLLSLGIAVITIIISFTNQLNDRINTNSKAIDLVVGAKGSPLQLILCNIFHVDFPTGNIGLAEAEKISKNRLIRKAIPLALGDSYQSFRIIGTNHDYTNLYHATLGSGSLWKGDMEVTLGSNVAAQTALKVGDTFTSSHGLTSGGHAHEEMNFKVAGILLRSNTVIDNLILTNIESIWLVHDIHTGVEDHDSTKNVKRLHVPSSLVPSVPMGDSLKQITSLLIQYRSPMGAIQLPRLINSQSSLQAASPAFESARLFSILGVGVGILTGFAYLLIFISALSIFIALYNALQERKYDLAIMRTMGASKSKLVFSVLLESSFLTFLGALLGIAVGHATLALLTLVEETQKAGISSLIFFNEEWIILAGSLLLGLLCGLLPAMQVYRTDISKVLAEN